MVPEAAQAKYAETRIRWKEVKTADYPSFNFEIRI